MKKMNKKGFTIVELSIVIAVIAILSAVLVPTFSGMVKNSKNTAAIQGAQNAYTQYIAEVVDHETEEPAEYLIYETDGKFVAFVKGKMVLNNEVPFATLAEAEATFGDILNKDDATTTDIDESNYTNPDTEIDGLTAYVLN